MLEIFFKCSCPSGLKRKFCKHNISLSINLYYKVPDNEISVHLDEKQRRGRPSKNKGW